jgi:hypothetical protein
MCAGALTSAMPMVAPNMPAQATDVADGVRHAADGTTALEIAREFEAEVVSFDTRIISFGFDAMMGPRANH